MAFVADIAVVVVIAMRASRIIVFLIFYRFLFVVLCFFIFVRLLNCHRGIVGELYADVVQQLPIYAKLVLFSENVRHDTQY